MKKLLFITMIAANLCDINNDMPVFPVVNNGGGGNISQTIVNVGNSQNSNSGSSRGHIINVGGSQNITLLAGGNDGNAPNPAPIVRRNDGDAPNPAPVVGGNDGDAPNSVPVIRSNDGDAQNSAPVIRSNDGDAPNAAPLATNAAQQRIFEPVPRMPPPPTSNVSTQSVTFLTDGDSGNFAAMLLSTIGKISQTNASIFGSVLNSIAGMSNSTRQSLGSNVAEMIIVSHKASMEQQLLLTQMLQQTISGAQHGTSSKVLALKNVDASASNVDEKI